MKKFIFSALAAIGLLLSPSCSDDNEALSGSGNEALVSFSVNLADGISTKAISDGTMAKQLFVRVFEDANGSVGQEITGLALNDQEMTNLQKDVNFTLVKGKTYHFLFWAQAYSSNESAPFSFEGNTVKVSYTSAKANDEKRDAFYAVKTINVSGSFEEGVTLKRPFAQLNFLTTKEDILAAINAGQNVDNTRITISSAAQTLSPFGTVSVSNEMQNVSFEAYEVPFTVSGGNVTSESSVYIKDDGTTSALAEGTQYFYLATTYFLVNNSEDATAQALVDVNMKVEGAEGDGLKVSSVPVRMNYRTNIYGNLITSQGNFKVTIDPDFSESDNNLPLVNNADEIAAAINKGITTIRLTPGTYIIPDDAKGKNLTFIGTGNPEDVKIATQDDGSYEGCDYSLDGATVTFENITINTNSQTYTGYVRCQGTYKNCVINGTYTLYGDSNFENCTFNVSGDVYNIWTWGAQDIVFDGCTFNSDGKALLLYQEGTNTVDLTVTNCIFNDNGGLTSKKAAIEIGDAPYGATPIYNVTVSGTTVYGYDINDQGTYTGTTLWGNKNSMPEDRLNVTVDGVEVY